MNTTHEFKTEVKQMLDLVIHSLYSNKEIFLRELISNASDAIDRAKFLGLTDKSLVADNPTWKIEIAVDKSAKTLMIADNGTGMDAADLEKNLGTIASSGTKAFRQALKEKGGENLPELIGQFGVGFYAAFMVADRVELLSRSYTGAPAVHWDCTEDGAYDDESLHEAALLAAYYSQAQGGSNVPVDYTSVKYVKKPAGARPGMVVYETYRTLYVTPDEEAIRRLDRKNK